MLEKPKKGGEDDSVEQQLAVEARGRDLLSQPTTDYCAIAVMHRRPTVLTCCDGD